MWDHCIPYARSCRQRCLLFKALHQQGTKSATTGQLPKTSVVDPDPHHIDKLDPYPDRIRNDLQITSQNVRNMSLFEHFFKVLRLNSEAKIRIRINLKGRIRIRSRIKVTSRIRIRINMRIRNTAYDNIFKLETQNIQSTVAPSRKRLRVRLQHLSQ